MILITINMPGGFAFVAIFPYNLTLRIRVLTGQCPTPFAPVF